VTSITSTPITGYYILMEADMLFRGTAPALVTPFTIDGNLDLAAFSRLIDDQIAGGVEGLVVLGTTGENPTITHEERRTLVDVAIEQADGRVPVIIGSGTNNTQQSITFSKEAAEAGADGLLVVGPYYNKPGNEGFVAHVKAIADATDCPQILYNVPGRTGYDFPAATTLRLADEVPSVVGVKEASGNLAQISDILAGRPEGFAVYAGDDEMAFPVIALGGDGVISVISNAVPAPFTAMVREVLAGRIEAAREAHLRLLEPMRACFYATNPTPVKAVLQAEGKMDERVRLPLVSPQDAVRERILRAFRPVLDAV